MSCPSATLTVNDIVWSPGLVQSAMSMGKYACMSVSSVSSNSLVSPITPTISAYSLSSWKRMRSPTASPSNWVLASVSFTHSTAA